MNIPGADSKVLFFCLSVGAAMGGNGSLIGASANMVTAGIDLALEYEARLAFLHIVDAEFLEYATIGPLSVVYAELKEMATFSMLILCDRAQRRGVGQVDYVLLEGNIHDGLIRYVNETKAEMIVIGRPTRTPGRNVFKINEFDEFVAELEQEGDLAIIRVPAEWPNTQS